MKIPKSEEDVRNMIKEFLKQAESMNEKADIILEHLSTQGYDISRMRKTVHNAKEIVEEAWSWSWKGSAIAGGICMAAGTCTGALYGGIPGAIVGGISGLISCGIIGGVFGNEFPKLVNRLKEVQVIFREYSLRTEFYEKQFS